MKKAIALRKISEQGMLCAVMLIALFLGGIISAAQTGEHIENSLVRLHILAESDSEEDQALKLKVRDAVLADSEEIFKPYSTKEEAERELAASLDKITATARKTLDENGCSLPVKAEITEMDIDRREYDSFTVPAGRYTALRITIGSGSGHNWWCVMYPPLCVPCVCADMTDEEIIEKYGSELTEEDLLMLSENEDYEVRLYIVEKLKELFAV